MDKAKIRLSIKEAELVANDDWILTKNAIIQKVKYMLEELQSMQAQALLSYGPMLPPEVVAIAPKISRGENYKGLPYLVLDLPRYFGKDDHFAIRTMFWWGNFFSITLYLSGRYKLMYENKIRSCLSALKENDFFIGVNDDQWEHHFETSNYLQLTQVNEADFGSMVHNKNFIKLARQVSLEQWNEAGELLLTHFDQLIKWLTS